MTALGYGQNRTITEATTILTIRMDRTDTIITVSALTTFRPTGITGIISTAAGTAGIVTNIGVRMTSKIPGCFRLISQSGPKPQSGFRNALDTADAHLPQSEREPMPLTKVLKSRTGIGEHRTF